MSHLEQREESVRESGIACTVMTAVASDCRWVTDKRTKTGFMVFCGKPVVKLSRPYCADHYPLIYVKPEKRK